MSAYYKDESITLHHGDSLEILPTLDVTADVLLTDPPYFKVKQDEWDNQWDKAGEFLGWMGEWLDHTKPLLAPHASVWVFASPAMTTSVERLVAERFKPLNSVRWVKGEGWHMKASLPGMRRYLTPWEGLILAEQYPETNVYPDRDQALHREVFAPAGDYIRQAREPSGLTQKQLGAKLSGYKNPDSARANVVNWELGKNLISERDYESVRSVLGLGGLPLDYQSVRAEWEKMQAEYDRARRPFNITDRAMSTDVWAFPGVKPYPGKHPCEKPQTMLTHMIETSSRPGWTILDPFAGSGSTLLAARNSGRKAIGIEKDEAWCEKIAQRLSENTLNLGEAA